MTRGAWVQGRAQLGGYESWVGRTDAPRGPPKGPSTLTRERNTNGFQEICPVPINDQIVLTYSGNKILLKIKVLKNLPGQGTHKHIKQYREVVTWIFFFSTSINI